MQISYPWGRILLINKKIEGKDAEIKQNLSCYLSQDVIVMILNSIFFIILFLLLNWVDLRFNLLKIDFKY